MTRSIFRLTPLALAALLGAPTTQAHAQTSPPSGNVAIEAGRGTFTHLQEGTLDPALADSLAGVLRPAALRGDANAQFSAIHAALVVLSDAEGHDDPQHDTEALRRVRALWNAYEDLLVQPDFRDDQEAQVLAIGELAVFALARASTATLSNDPTATRDDAHLDLARMAVARAIVRTLPRGFEPGSIADEQVALMEHLLDQPWGGLDGDEARTPRHDGWIDERFALWLGARHRWSMEVLYDPAVQTDPGPAMAHYREGTELMEQLAAVTPEATHRGLALMELAGMEQLYPDHPDLGGARAFLEHQHAALMRGLEAHVVGQMDQGDWGELRQMMSLSCEELTLGYWSTIPDDGRVQTYAGWLAALRGDVAAPGDDRVRQLDLSNWNEPTVPVTAPHWASLGSPTGLTTARAPGLPRAWVSYYFAARSAEAQRQAGRQELPSQAMSSLTSNATRLERALDEELNAGRMSAGELADARRYVSDLIQLLSLESNAGVDTGDRVARPWAAPTLDHLLALDERLAETPSELASSTGDVGLYSHAPRTLPTAIAGFEGLLADEIELLVLRRGDGIACGGQRCDPATDAIPALLTYGLYKLEGLSEGAALSEGRKPSATVARIYRDLVALLSDPRHEEAQGVAWFIQQRAWSTDETCTDELGQTGCSNEALGQALWGRAVVPSDGKRDVQSVLIWFRRQNDLQAWVAEQLQGEVRGGDSAWGLTYRSPSTGGTERALQLLADAAFRESATFASDHVRSTLFSTPVRDDKQVELFLPVPSGGMQIVTEEGESVALVVRQGTGGRWLTQLAAEGSDLRLCSPLLVERQGDR